MRETELARRSLRSERGRSPTGTAPHTGMMGGARLVMGGCGPTVGCLRISLTDECDLRCRSCAPRDEVDCRSRSAALTDTELVRVVTAAVSLGLTKVRLTGGEPLLRPGVVRLVQSLSQIAGLTELSMTTNGTRLSAYASPLKRAGLHRVNIGLDSLDRERYRWITGRDSLEWALRGIDAALRVGLAPVKVNVVVMRGVNDDEILDFAKRTVRAPLHVRFIEMMPIGEAPQRVPGGYMPVSPLIEDMRGIFKLTSAAVVGSGPARHFRLPGARGTVGFITPISHPFCGNCTRVRLTSDGKLMPCLASDLQIGLGDGYDRIGCVDIVAQKMREAIETKTAGLGLVSVGQPQAWTGTCMLRLGG